MYAGYSISSAHLCPSKPPTLFSIRSIYPATNATPAFLSIRTASTSASVQELTSSDIRSSKYRNKAGLLPPGSQADHVLECNEVAHQINASNKSKTMIIRKGDKCFELIKKVCMHCTVCAMLQYGTSIILFGSQYPVSIA